MKPLLLTIAFCAKIFSVFASSDLIDITKVYIQPIDSYSPVSALAEISYNPSTLEAEIVSFNSPEITSESRLMRIGVYDVATSTWKSSTSMTSAESFSKGFQPTLLLSLDAQGGVLGISCKSGKIDAGQTREFRPRVIVLKTLKAKQPDLNRPIVLSPEGKLEVPVPEKTMLQKYWWVILGAVMLLMTAGGGGE